MFIQTVPLPFSICCYLRCTFAKTVTIIKDSFLDKFSTGSGSWGRTGSCFCLIQKNSLFLLAYEIYISCGLLPQATGLQLLFPRAQEKKILTIRNIHHDCVTNSEQKKELLDFWFFFRPYLLYEIVIIEQELSICIPVPAEIHLLLRNRRISVIPCAIFWAYLPLLIP